MFCTALSIVHRNLVTRLVPVTQKRGMKLLQFMKDGNRSVGAMCDDTHIVDLTNAHESIPNNMVDFLAGGPDLLSKAKSILSEKKNTLLKDEIKVLSPITGCEKVMCVGLNYKDHCIEQNVALPTEPLFFCKFPSSIIGDGDDIVLPKLSKSVDWEVELAVVIGKEAKNLDEEEALDCVAGYTVAHDVSARDWQMERNGKQWLLGKTFDTFCPLGPVLVTKDSVADPHNLRLRCIVNGNVVQDGSTNQLVFGVGKCVSWISKICTLKPGDVLLTGTPPGVGVFRKPPVFLKAGDTVVCEIDGIGKLTNPVVAEK